MKKSIILGIALLLIVGSSLALGAEALQKNMIPGKAKWFIHIDVQKLAQTKLKDVLLGTSGSDFSREISEIEETAQISFFEDISAVTAVGMGMEDEKIVIAFSGNLNKGYLLGLLMEEESHKEIEYGNFVVHNWDDDGYGAFINDSLVLISESKGALTRVLDTYSGKGKDISTSFMGSELDALSTDMILVLAADDISGLVGEEDDFPSAILKKTKTALLTLNEKNDRIKMKLSMDTDSPETAKNMEDMVAGLRAFLAMGEVVDPEWDLIKSLKIGVNGTKVILQSEGSMDEFIKVILGLDK